MLGFLLFAACEEPIDSPFELVEPRLVMTSTFAPGQMVEVRLSASQPVTGEVRLLEIRDADVRIYEGSNLVERLEYLPPLGADGGYYQTTDFQPVVGRTYTLLASAEGFTPISAESSIPTSVPIKDIRLENITLQHLATYDVYDFLLTVDYEDPPEEGNYYDLRLSQQLIPYRVTNRSDTTYYAAVTKGLQVPESLDDLNRPTVSHASVLVVDKPTAAGVQVRLQVRVDPRKELLGDLVAELRTVSEPYFQFQRTIQDVGRVYGGLSEQGVNNYTNVQEGFGLFAGYNSTTGTIRIADR